MAKPVVVSAETLNTGLRPEVKTEIGVGPTRLEKTLGSRGIAVMSDIMIQMDSVGKRSDTTKRSRLNR
jgi:hypothetical protein